MARECMCFKNYICLACEDGVKPKTSRPSNRKVAQCGTRAGYQRHLKQGEPTCAECKAAQSAAVSQYNKAKALR